MKKDNLTWSDAEVKFMEALLLATGGEGGAALKDTLLMADAIDGTVFEYKELELALYKLAAIGYLEVQKNKLYLTNAFRVEYEAAVSGVPEISDKERISELLNCHNLIDSQIGTAEEQLKKYKLKNHYQQYQEQFG